MQEKYQTDHIVAGLAESASLAKLVQWQGKKKYSQATIQQNSGCQTLHLLT
jgi:hypothetical protein